MALALPVWMIFMIVLPEPGALLNAMARLKRDEMLKQRISEETGMLIGDINAQNSRCFEIKTLYFQDLFKRACW